MTQDIDAVRNQLNPDSNGDDLRRIVREAIDHVLERPDGRRGPYRIDNEQLKSGRVARAS